MSIKKLSKAVVILLLLCVTLLGCSKVEKSNISTTKYVESTTFSTTKIVEKSTEKTTKIEQKTTTKSVESTTKKAKSTSKNSAKNSTKSYQKPTKIPDEISTTMARISPDDEELTTAKKANVCTLTIECKEIQKNIDDLAPGHSNFVPKNGYIISRYDYKINGKTTVYDVLKQACDDNNIILTSRNTQYGNYIVGINNLDEKDCGKYSGWIYYVNGSMPNFACDKYEVKAGDRIQFSYTCEQN